ncbi:MAG: glutaredoxin 3 [Devosiaceae bacterium]|nr:glutaredoxin 3 [Devosiaceae bacterium]
MPKVQIYTTPTCPYCHAAKNLLNEKNIEFVEISVVNPTVREKMMERAGGRRSVPQIFFGETHIGGFDDLAELDRKNRLEPLLEKMRV